MAVDFFFDNPTFQIPSLSNLRTRWSNVPNPLVIETIACEYQYLYFQGFITQQVRSTSVGDLMNPPYTKPLGLSVREGAIKSALLIYGSIAEAVLRAHAEKRGYKLHTNLRKRTFGNILNAWKLPNGTPHSDILSIWTELQMLKDFRDNVHLFKAVTDPSSSNGNLLKKERDLFDNANKICTVLRNLVS